MENIFSRFVDDYDETIGLMNALDDWIFIKNLPLKRQRVLDIGCGSGHLLQLMSRYFKYLYGIDNSEEMIKKAKKNLKKASFCCQDANFLPYPREYFDYVISHTAFHHLKKEKALEEARRVLKKGGKLLIVDVAWEQNKLIDIFEIIFLRFIWAFPRMVIRFSFKKTIKAWQFRRGPIWQTHARKEKNIHFNKEQFKEFYLRFLPEAKFGIINHKIAYLVWEKR